MNDDYETQINDISTFTKVENISFVHHQFHNVNTESFGLSARENEK